MHSERRLLPRGLRAALFLAAFVALLVPTVYWVEAEKEAHILCGMARRDVPQSEIVRMFGTAELLRVETIERGDTLVLRAATPAPIGHRRCELRLHDGVVRGRAFGTSLPTLTIATFALLLCIPAAWVSRRRARAVVQVALGVGTLLLAIATLQRIGVPRLSAVEELSSVILAAALLVAVAIATRDATAAHTPSHWRRIIAPTIIALACAILLLAPPTP